MLLPDMLVYSIGSAALNATVMPGVLDDWVKEITSEVAAKGKFSKISVAYVPFSPPPVFWDYKCFKCLAWQEPSKCKWVAGEISRKAWCALWVPPNQYKAFSWPKELIQGRW